MVISLSTIRQKAWSDLCNNAAIYSRRSKYIACSQISYKLLLEYFLKAMNLKYHRGERLITQRSHGKLKMTFFPKRILSKGNKIKSTVFWFFFTLVIQHHPMMKGILRIFLQAIFQEDFSTFLCIFPFPCVRLLINLFVQRTRDPHKHV